jgi:hypothetical protein
LARNKEGRAGQPSEDLDEGDPNRGSRAHVCKLAPEPTNILRIPQKGYRVHLAVSPNPYGGNPMVKFAKLVKSAKIAGGLSGW